MTAATTLPEVEAALATRWPESRIEPSTERIHDLVDVLGNPQQAVPVIHVAGTNGKTSTARMIDDLLRSLGLRTGRFTSPHLESVTERICLNGEPVDAERFVAAYADLAPYLDLVDQRHGIRLSFFEVLTAMAFATFADTPVDVAVVEVGLGGTWDATNVADAAVAVITPVALDHVDYLGATLTDIAGEKAGVIKADSLAVISQQDDEVAEVLLDRATEVGATVLREGLEFGVRKRDRAVGGQLLSLQGLTGPYDEIFLPLHGAHQTTNAASALAAVEALVGGGRKPLDIDAVRAAFSTTSSPGRLEVLRRDPTVLIDAAHNPASAQALASTLQEEFAFTRLVGVAAVLADKDARGILEQLEPVLAELVVSENSSPRALPATELAAVAGEVLGPDRVAVVARLPDAIEHAVARAEQGMSSGAGVLITGSVVTAGDARHLFGDRG